MPLCTLDDINVFLPEDKLGVLNADDDALQLDAERIIKGTMSGTFSAATIALWTTPVTTPNLLRAIAGRLIAALVYARAFSSEVDAVPEYAQKLYDEAMSMMASVISGDITLVDVVEETTVGERLTDANFYPTENAPGPFFTMTQAF